MKNLVRLAVAIAALLATYAGAWLARSDTQTLIQQNGNQAKVTEWVEVKLDKNGQIVPVAKPDVSRKTGNTEKMQPAGWLKVEGNEFVTFYVDPATISKAGDKATMLTLVDFKTASKRDGHPYMSTKTHHEYDCKENKWRLLNYSYFSGNLGTGKQILSDSEPGQWMPVKPGSGTQIRLKIACEKR